MKKLKILFIIICAFQLYYLFQHRSNFKYEIIKNPFHKDAGIVYALSPAVIESKEIIKNKEVLNFNLSENLIKDTYFYQRSIEFNYPVRLNKSSQFIFYNLEEDIPNNCQVIETGKYVKLIQC
tara:strand:- start:645 stop:1013 length:369 start_codon:yes stop_codon:yes gene_type:complete